MKYLVVLEVEAKEDDSGVFPDPHEVRAVVRDVLTDSTKHNSEIGWRVSRVEGLTTAFQSGVMM